MYSGRWTCIRDTRLLPRLLSALCRVRPDHPASRRPAQSLRVPGSPARHDDVLSFYGAGATIAALPFFATIKDMKALLHNA